jgi:hypothetical protein
VAFLGLAVVVSSGITDIAVLYEVRCNVDRLPF